MREKQIDFVREKQTSRTFFNLTYKKIYIYIFKIENQNIILITVILFYFILKTNKVFNYVLSF